MWKIDSTLHMENKSPQFFEREYQFDIYVLGSVFAPYLLFSVGKKKIFLISAYPIQVKTVISSLANLYGVVGVTVVQSLMKYLLCLG